MIEKPPKADTYATSGRRMRGYGEDPEKARARVRRFRKAHGKPGYKPKRKRDEWEEL